ncbi:MAG: HNH endonuclease [Anaerolineae bacterium]|nr:HNH endonuclease [Anaerolineae bacterium]
MSYIPDAIRKAVRRAAGNRCGYCLAHQDYVLGRLEIEHIIPVATGGSDDESNLWLACRSCNQHKGVQTHAADPETGLSVRLFNPRIQIWSEHFAWSADGIHIIGLTPCGRATVEALRLNDKLAVRVRSHWVRAGWHPPTPQSGPRR